MPLRFVACAITTYCSLPEGDTRSFREICINTLCKSACESPSAAPCCLYFYFDIVVAAVLWYMAAKPSAYKVQQRRDICPRYSEQLQGCCDRIAHRLFRPVGRVRYFLRWRCVERHKTTSTCTVWSVTKYLRRPLLATYHKNMFFYLRNAGWE